MGRRSDIDWDAIERAYRLGTQTNKQLAVHYGVEPSTIGRRATKYGWVQDRNKDVVVATESLLIQAASGNANVNATPTQTEVKVAAQVAADVVLGHRKGLRRLSALRDKLLSEIEVVTDNPEEFERLGELLDMTDTDSKGNLRIDKLNQLYRKIISMPERVDAFKKLSEVDERVRKGEREAFNIGAEGDKKTSVEDHIDLVKKKLGLK